MRTGAPAFGRCLAADRIGRSTTLETPSIEPESAVRGRCKMDWNIIEGMQQKYGYAADEAARRADEWAKQQDAKQ